MYIIYIIYIYYIYISFNVVERFTKRRNVLKFFFYFFEYPMYSRNIFKIFSIFPDRKKIYIYIFNKDCFCFFVVHVYI